jgi:phospholipid transport system substrate-binding protein
MSASAPITVSACAWMALASLPAITRPTAADEVASAPSMVNPQALIADLSSQLLAGLDQDSGAIRRHSDRVLALIDRLLSPHFDADYTARLVLGEHWRSATPDQRQRFAVAFYQRLLRTYVGAVTEWTADRFKLLPMNRDAEALQVAVPTEVTSAVGTRIRVDYRLRRTNAGWKIFDVIVDGVSYVRSYNDDVDTDVARNGLDAAIARLARPDTVDEAPAAPRSHWPP